ncbi:pre-mRNA-processing ATP-dependent RNA helicase Prp5p [Diutina catenulata]
MSAPLTKEEKLRLRRQKLEELKRQKAASSAGSTPKSSASPPPQRLFTLKKKPVAVKKTREAKKRVFEEEEEGTETTHPMKQFKPPQETSHEAKKDEGEDALDVYIASLSQNEPVETRETPSVHENSDSESEEEGEDLLEAKLAKLNQEKVLTAQEFDPETAIKIRKDFYTESEELAAMSEVEVSLVRFDLGRITVEGENPPRPVTKWSQLGLPQRLMDTIEQLQYPHPSPIQAQALPAIMAGRDVVGVANTGSGKTMAFVLPMLRHVLDQPNLEPGDGPIAVILTPTRELAIQIHREIGRFAGVKAAACYGGSNIESQIAELKRGVEVVVATPGRLIDLLSANGGRLTNLQRTSYVVLDEADRMFDMGFEPQVTKIFSQVVRPDHQTILFSATFPRKMEMLAKKVLVHSPLKITVGGVSKVGKEITQKVEYFEEEGASLDDAKLAKLLPLIKESNTKVLIFVEKQTMADKLLVTLLKNQVPAVAIHGGKDQIDRKHAIKEFSKAGSGVDTLIATSIAARGLDVKGLDLVINYDPASHLEDYVHRVGRTGRAGNVGTAVTFVSAAQERAIADLVRALTDSNQPVPSILEEKNQEFLAKMKAGKTKYSFGFAGKGLEKLEEHRVTERAAQTSSLGEDAPANSKPATKTATPEVSQLLPSFDVVAGPAPETSGPDTSKFHTRIVINDLPQAARWHIVNRESLGKIIESTRASITNKGQFYAKDAPTWPPAEFSRDMKPPPKLYLLVEGLTESMVAEANAMIRDRMISGLDVAAIEEKSGPAKKYKV